jgi:hypothetical protein
MLSIDALDYRTLTQCGVARPEEMEHLLEGLRLAAGQDSGV